MENAEWVFLERIAGEQPVPHPDGPVRCGRSG